METNENNFEEREKKTSASFKSMLKDLISGRFIVGKNIQKHIGYLFFVFILAMFYIGYRYKVESTAIENKKIEQEIKAMQAEFLTKKIDLMRLSKHSEILKQVQKRSLSIKEPKNPPQRIVVEK